MRLVPESGFVAFVLFAGMVLATTALPAVESAYPTIGHIERIDPRLDRLIPRGAVLGRVSAGHEWTEGPLWDAHDGSLLFSDVPRNTVLRWTERSGATVFCARAATRARSISRGASPTPTGSRSIAREGSCCASTASAGLRGSSGMADSRCSSIAIRAGA